MIEEDIYTYRPWPWMSKSSVLSDDFCEWLFYLRYIKKIETGVGLSAHTGTNMHAVMAIFFDRIDISELVKIPINYEEPIEQSRIFNYMLKTIFELVPIDSREYKPYRTSLTNFCLIEADHWISLNEEFNGNFTEVYKYWMPTIIEKYLEHKDVNLYGTLDRKSMHHTPKKTFHEVYDYKTGHVPKQIKRGLKDPDDEFSWSMPTNKMFELHFYVMLDICRRGFRINQRLIDFITKEENFRDDVEMPKVKNHFLDSKGNGYDFTKDYRVGIIFTGSVDGPYVPKKKANKRSMTAVFRRINKLKTKVYQNHAWSKDVNFFKCKNCSIIKECLDELEMVAMGFEPETTV